MHLHANLSRREQGAARTRPLNTGANDVLAWLEQLGLCRPRQQRILALWKIPTHIGIISRSA
jgi:hypothetical protein